MQYNKLELCDVSSCTLRTQIRPPPDFFMILVEEKKKKKLKVMNGLSFVNFQSLSAFSVTYGSCRLRRSVVNYYILSLFMNLFYNYNHGVVKNGLYYSLDD